jgi:uncharacterized membrane protein
MVSTFSTLRSRNPLLAKLSVKGVDANVATAVRTSVGVVFTWMLAYLARQPNSLSFV